MSMTYKQDLRDIAVAVAQQAKAYTDKKIEDLAWVLGGNTLDVETDTTTAYQKSVPSGVYNPNGTPKALLNIIGGMSYKSDLTIGTINNGSISANGVIETNNSYKIKIIEVENGKTYYFNGVKTQAVVGYYASMPEVNSQAYDNSRHVYNNVSSFTSDYTGYAGIRFSNEEVNSTIIYNGITDSAVSSVVSKDSEDTTIDTYTIPAEIQALEGYGYGINDNCYNYIDFDSKKFIENDKRILGSSLTGWRRRSDVSGKNTFSLGIPNVYKYISTVKALSSRYTFSGTIQGYVDMANKDDMTFCLYQTGSTTSADCMIYINDSSCSNASELETAIANETFDFEIDTIETDISQYIDNNFIEVEENGTLTFNNTYEQSVPSDIDYLVKEVKA